MTASEARALLARLLGRIAPEADLDAVDPDGPFQEALELDSMDFLNLVTAVEEDTGRSVPERDYPALSTVSGFVAYLTTA
ncbi:acyl carrier protein [Iamia sp. SCSIO 61187]|uniref:acyl carrier protein n=1 Tax=Iamia sp. SCSIO 61187 TaxID=2722752 RepID=UPI001C63058F|nr:acyl carrier protein [Iamia sp. SCSIO 61187]QYG93531.1 acyl carrier protein [Iamia sp. SCSIO 61187]